MLCSEASLVNHGERKVRVITLWCRCWSCEMCEPGRKRRVCREVAEGQPNIFLTLTTRYVEGGDPVAEARRQGDAFAALARLIRKRWKGREFEYYVVREATKRGWPHLHLMIRSGFIPAKWLVEQWKALTGSYVVKIKAIYRVGNVAAYLAKYIGKAPHRFGTTKRYWHSRGWFDVRPPEPKENNGWDSKWYIDRKSVQRLAERYYLMRWEFTLGRGLGGFEARAPP